MPLPHQAYDADDKGNGRHVYEIPPGRAKTGAKFFHIDPATGTVSTAVTFDREDRQIYTFQVSGYLSN